MFADLVRRLTAPAPTRLTDSDARLALGALLVRVAHADGTYGQVEIDRIDAVLAKRHALSPFEAAALRVRCERLESEAPDTVRFTRAIKAAVPYEDREAVIESLWEVVLADGVREVHEDTLMRSIAPLLGVEDQDSNRVRRRVEGRS